MLLFLLLFFPFLVSSNLLPLGFRGAEAGTAEHSIPGPSGLASGSKPTFHLHYGAPPPPPPTDSRLAHLPTRMPSPERLTSQWLSELIRLPRAWLPLTSNGVFPPLASSPFCHRVSAVLEEFKVGQISLSKRLQVKRLQENT